jgi:hypothetical protein
MDRPSGRAGLVEARRALPRPVATRSCPSELYLIGVCVQREDRVLHFEAWAIVLQVASLMISTELAKRRFVQLKQNLAQFLGLGIPAAAKLRPQTLRNVLIRVLPCLWLI